MVDPGALATWANAITVGRLLLSPLMFWVIPDHPKGAWVAFVLWFVLCSSDAFDGYLARRHGTTPVGRVPRSARRQGPRARRHVHARRQRRVLGRAGRDHRGARVRHQHVPHRRRREGRQRAGQQDGQEQDAGPAAGRRLRPAAADGGRRDVAVERRSCGSPWCWPWSAGGQYLRGSRSKPADRARCGSHPESPRLDRRSLEDSRRRATIGAMRCDVLAVGTELLLGQIIDTNSSWIGEQLALHGIESLLQVKVGDNVGAHRGGAAPRCSTDADAVIVSRRPRPDPRRRDPRGDRRGDGRCRAGDRRRRRRVIRRLFADRGRAMPENNLRQALVPVGATVIPQTRGTAPGLICPVGDKVIYAVPGRAPRDEGHARAGGPARPRRPQRRHGGDRQPRPEDVGRERERPQRAARRHHRPARRGRRPDDGVPGQRLGGPRGAPHDAPGERRGGGRAILDEWEAEVRAVLGPLVFGVDDDSRWRPSCSTCCARAA